MAFANGPGSAPPPGVTPDYVSPYTAIPGPHCGGMRYSDYGYGGRSLIHYKQLPRPFVSVSILSFES